MIVLDTNVISELGRSSASEKVKRWCANSDEVHTITAITAAEMFRGIKILPAGSRRDAVEAAVTQQLAEFDTRGGILHFDIAAAWMFGEVTATRKAMGRPIADADAMIAAICLAHRAPLATRNIKDFEGTGVNLINPWD